MKSSAILILIFLAVFATVIASGCNSNQMAEIHTATCGMAGPVVVRVPGGLLKVTSPTNENDWKWRWTFVPNGTAKEIELPDLLSGYQVELLVSSDDKYLAVLSEDEGCYYLSVVDLQVLLRDKQVKEVAATGSWPGTISLQEWRGNRLVIASDEFLTLPHSEDESAVLFSDKQQFAIDASTGKIEATSQDSKNPIPYFTAQLSSDNPDVWNAMIALRRLKAVQSLPEIRKALAACKDQDSRELITKTIDYLQTVASQPTTIPAT